MPLEFAVRHKRQKVTLDRGALISDVHYWTSCEIKSSNAFLAEMSPSRARVDMHEQSRELRSYR